MKLFPQDQIIGVFRGFSEGGFEFHADLVLPYRADYQNMPMHGQFLLVQLGNDHEGVLGRITSISSEGRLASSAGEDFNIRAISAGRDIPDDIREQYLKYRINLRVLGVVRIIDDKLIFIASHRRLPHVGSKVAFLSEEILKEVAGHNIKGAELGFFALGEYIYSGTDSRLSILPWMQLKNPAIIPKFDINNIVSRRTFVFARAGFGKSNLNKLLFSNLYKETPTTKKRGRDKVPVGTIIFDPDGEYFWPDDKSRPGLCDVKELEDKIVIFTKRKAPSRFYQSFVASDIKIDIRRLRPAEVLAIALPPEKQEQQNIRKLKSLNDSEWQELVDEIFENGNGADAALIRRILKLEDTNEAEMVAARSNMTALVKMLHDPSSQMLDMILYSLKNGKICIVDLSQMRGSQGLVLSSLILQKIFEINQQEFTKAKPETIPTIAVVEEAQTVLGNSAGSSGEGPYISWVKEGRKYDLGMIMITQQPGSISGEILSQGDNWFVFHLLSGYDLQVLKKANAHFSDDILSSLLNEPIRGHGVYWSSSNDNQTYPIPIRVLSFENMYNVRDPDFCLDESITFTRTLKEKFNKAIPKTELSKDTQSSDNVDEDIEIENNGDGIKSSIDIMESYFLAAIDTLKADKELIDNIRKFGIPWKGIQVRIKDALPDIIENEERERLAFTRVSRALNEIFGEGKWDTERRPRKSGSGYTTWIIVKYGDE
ncbi:ATPase [Methanocella sp. CWC-04]|uniref:ATPase n=1 Tax=Methanooceanicella nereidis TaxID=2052831 RepID=A0AAP2R9S0_9EURY|nr:DUF87 domain-containing protein [Methanocella sp. CWC-04]MCD1293521.1 ATPase [Methanocella sp. CWC-04]